MATDNTPPRLNLIVTIAVITVITLFGIEFVTRSYFAMMSDEAAKEKIAPTTERTEYNKARDTAFAAATMPIAQAAAMLGSKRPESLSAQQSDDLNPMKGWTKLPKPEPTPIVRPEPLAADAGASDAGTSDASADAGPKNPQNAPAPKH